ncbi:MAG: hybrid sensor histidine kinase/response regulator [Neptuniibacter caesariensis]|uniref:Chemotaxis protein CheA n=1 Tax=Neptuniibacter caesariensis TaxID=207954 RepID=A0A2G6JP22_NEPCE|nr:MAG: hybrid sensor histidine kinase/response regulator [Neptuniibacter caesariensis]
MFDPKQAIEWLISKQQLCLSMELPLTELIAEINQYVDQFSEEDLSGLADLFALYGELLESLDGADLKDYQSLIGEVAQQLAALFSEPAEVEIRALAALLQDSRWPDPVPAEDANFLLDLLQDDCARLTSTTDKTAAGAGNDHVDCPSNMDGQLPGLYSLLHKMGESLPDFTEELSDQFYELIDDYSERDWAGVADLLALYGELLAQLPDMAEGAVAKQLNAALLQLFKEQSEASVTSVFELMQNNTWPEPVAEEDTAFLAELLIQDLQRLSDSAENSIELVTDDLDTSADDLAALSLLGPDGTLLATEEETRLPEEVPAALDSDVSVVDENTVPAFCRIDISLLEEQGPQVEPAVIEMLSQSIRQLAEQWQNDEPPQTLASESQEALTTVARALETINLIGVKVLVEGLMLNFELLQKDRSALTSERKRAIQSCLSAFNDYFADIDNYAAQQTLLDQFVDTPLLCRPTTDEASFIMGLLALATLQTSKDIVQEQASPDDVALHESGAIDPQLLDMLHNELPALSDELLSSMQRVLDQDDKTALRNAQRAVHTLKGLANMAGIRGLANIAHRLEDVMDFLTEAEQLPGPGLKGDMLEACDCIASISEAVTDGSAAPSNALPVLQSIMDWDYRLKTEGVEALQSDQTAVRQDGNAQTVETSGAAEEAENSATIRSETPVFRVPRNILDNLFRLAGESSTLNTQLDEEITQLRGFTRVNRDRHRNLQRILFELEQQFSEQMSLQPQFDESSEEFDPLEMDRYNEMHTVISRVQEAVADVRDVTQDMERHIQNLNALHIAQSGLQKETLENVLNTRLVEARTISSRLQRILRQACRVTDKQARLVIVGEDTLVDSHILNQLADPLLHIIRNAVDHGLESPNLRKQRQKPEQGTITLTFALRNDQIQVTCQDDGDGINTQKVLAIANEKQLINPDMPITAQDAHRLILIPGFSTRAGISQLSGRGIGMDVVYQQILRLQGTLDISSVSGEGTTFSLSMPASSLMIRTLLVRCGKQVFALAGHGVEQSLLSLDGKLRSEGDQLFFDYAGEELPTYALEGLLEQSGYNYLDSGAVNPVLIINMGSGERAAVLVKEIIAHRELAFKQMSDFVPEIPGIPGLTILANGEAAPIIDLPGRVRHQRTMLSDMPVIPEIAGDLELPRLLVVDDSLSARKSLEILLKDTGYEVMTAIDGLDALNQIRKRQPDLILTDMEMPRMSGVELSAVLSNREETADIPVVMITSRSTEKHRREAMNAGIKAYLTKPWTENQLLDLVENLLADAYV